MDKLHITRDEHGYWMLSLEKADGLTCPAISGPTEIPDGHPLGRLLQHGGDLLDGESFPLHGTPPGPMGLIVPQHSPSIWSEKPGAPHL